MWVFLNDAFLSIVTPDQRRLTAAQKAADVLMVRARFKGDIERVFPDAAVEATAADDFARDYGFRTMMPRKVVAEAMVGEVNRIDYGNFKSSTKEEWRHDVYMRCWIPMKAEQDKRQPKPRRTMAGDPWGDTFWDAQGYRPAPKGKAKAKARKGGAA